jgi:hypothetical protein
MGINLLRSKVYAFCRKCEPGRRGKCRYRFNSHAKARAERVQSCPGNPAEREKGPKFKLNPIKASKRSVGR